MEFHFLGTGAADWDWQDYPPGTRGSTMTLVNRRVLIDAGPSLERNFSLAGEDVSCVEAILITHSHDDHFNPEQITRLAQKKALDVYASPQALARLEHPAIRKHPLQVGDVTEICGMKFTALLANHRVDDIHEMAFHYLIQSEGKNVLYALDGAWFTSSEKSLLEKLQLDAIIWDATTGNHYFDWRFADHNDLKMIDEMRVALTSANMITKNTKVLFDHIARTLWPETPAERSELAKKHQGVLLEDGVRLTL